ncbi:hypothetical protein [Streptomyces sp. NPDC101455]|uniref:hypothetical protein n=1 Tax=Streptomyces sp. NPDC101455 TaxID=3366142 RepID=UPI00380E83BC
MDPISVALLAAMAGGLGGEAGQQAWQGLVALIRRPFRHTEAVSSGEPELTALTQTPDDSTRAHALSTALAVRAAVDADFRQAPEEWWQFARTVGERDRGVNNLISGGSYQGPVILGRDISGNTFTNPPAPPAPSA